MVTVVSCSLLTAEAWVQSHENIPEICDIQIGTGTGFFQVLRYSSHMVPQMPHIHSTIRHNAQSWQLTMCLNNTPQKKFKIGYVTKRGGKEEKHAKPNLPQPLARISKII